MLQIALLLLFIRLAFCSQESEAALFYYLQSLQNICLTPVENSPLPSIYGSIVCGAKPSTSDQNLFKHLGLYHLLIVSGAHVVFLEAILNLFFKKHTYLKMTLLFIYGCFCQMAPPILRALLQLSLKQYSQQKRLFLPSHFLTLLSGCGALLVFPEWFSSYSLLISWTASLSLTFSSKKPIQCALAYGLTYPLLYCFASQSPLAIIYNLIFGTIFSLIFFPLILITFFIPPLHKYLSEVWSSLFAALQWLPSVQAHSQGEPMPPILIWLYVFGLHLIALIRTHRNSNCATY